MLERLSGTKLRELSDHDKVCILHKLERLSGEGPVLDWMWQRAVSGYWSREIDSHGQGQTR